MRSPCFFHVAWVLVLVGGAAPVCTGTGRETPDRPNFVLILADDQAFGDFGFMGNAQVKTPNLDALARSSARFLNGYVPTSVCRPSLATLLTGLYPHQHRIHFNHPPPGFSQMKELTVGEWNARRAAAEHFIRDVPTLPRVLAEHGYACFQAGKHWEGDFKNAGFTHGMTLNKPSSEPAYGNRKLKDGWVAHGNGDAGLNIGRDTMQPIFDFIREHKDQPFLVWYAPFLPHTPFDAAERFRSPYERRGDIPANMVGYYAQITRFDETVGELIKYVEDQGLADRTMFVFVVDNGFRPTAKPGSDGTYGPDDRSKLSPFENGVRTPILIRWNGHTQPATHLQLVQSTDIMPTVLAAARLEKLIGDLPGIDLMPAARGAKPLPNRPAFGEIYPNDASALGRPADEVSYLWVRDGYLKLIERVRRNGGPSGGQESAIELFDLEKDPDERQNLATSPDHAADVSRLKRLLDHWWQPALPHRPAEDITTH
ncbi:MAG: sulfatase-like hydrolase/transferase [Planctomycetes bacterium]|nr:sulfatase-like hydrolase/transferase [Planctomycetota bacterium]